MTLVREILIFIGKDRLLAAHPAYAQGNWLGKVLEAAVLHLTASASVAADWSAALDAYEGVHAVPLMTIHKSKGLEYHTVIFVGLDDDAWRRSFVEDPAEATAGFFVAFTRAKQRVLFTYCAGVAPVTPSRPSTNCCSAPAFRSSRWREPPSTGDFSFILI